MDTAVAGSMALPLDLDSIQSRRMMLDMEALSSTQAAKQRELDLSAVPDLEDVSIKDTEFLAWQNANQSNLAVFVDPQLEGLD
jgi:hypothetical protein